MAKSIAANVTEYRRHSHADVIIGKLLEGPSYDGKNLYNAKVVSMFCDQFPVGDMARALSKKYGFRLCATIEESLTLGGNSLAVDGVMNIGEHGKYPTNDKGQLLYPRRRFFEEVCNVFTKVKKAVPVFNDKHLAATWADAKWMYDKARELGVPFLAGSSLPVTWRKPEFSLPKESPIVEAVQLGYGPIEGYGFHALEAMQCVVERRRGGETGVAAVQCLSGDDMWKACDRGAFSRALLEEAIRRAPSYAKGDYRKTTAAAKEAAVWLIEYRDGFKGAVAILNNFLYEGDGGAFCLAVSVKGDANPRSCQFYLQQPDPFAHFGKQIEAFVSTMETMHTAYPIERTLLTTGMLDAAMTSRHEGGKRIETPHLKIEYRPSDWPHATGPIPPTIKR
jgi:hypothetical protein